MALHKVTETYKVNILGKEITYTNRFIRHTKGTAYGFKPAPHLVSGSSHLFKYEYIHAMLPPTLFISSTSGKKYIVPTWQEVHPETTLNDIEWIKPEKIEVPVEKDVWKFESSSDPGHFYTVKKSGLKLTCNCSGFYRAKDRNKGCKHVQEVRKQLN